MLQEAVPCTGALALGNPDENGPRTGKGYVHFLFGVGAILLASAVFHTSVFLVKGTSWEGYVSWRKPIVFAISFAITNLTVAWVFRSLPRARRKGWLLALTFGLTAIGEVGLITLQQWRGVPAHFNAVTSFDLGVVIAMGVLFVPLLLSLLGIAIWSWISLPRGTNLTFGVRMGMAFLIMGQVVGLIMLFRGMALLRVNDGNVAALYPAMNAYKIPHAIFLHAVQALFVIGALADRALASNKTGKWVVIFASLSILTAAGLSFPR